MTSSEAHQLLYAALLFWGTCWGVRQVIIIIRTNLK